VLARSSQPEVGWLGWRNTQDEYLLQAIAESCGRHRGSGSIAMSELNHIDSVSSVVPSELIFTLVAPSWFSEQAASLTVQSCH